MPTAIRQDQQSTYPFKIANDFDDDLIDYVQSIGQVFEKWWQTSGVRGLIKRQITQDAPDPFERLFRQLQGNLDQVYQKENVRSDVEKMARLVTTKAHVDIQSDISGVIGYDPMLRNKKSRELAQKTIRESVSYIKSIPEEYHREIQRTIFDGVRKGMPFQEIGDQLQDVYSDVTAARTKTIAMDQTGNLYGAITKAQHQALGLKRFEWIAVMDGRTRPRHQDFHGQEFLWSEGANGEYPGSAINCRCSASTVESEIMEVMGR